MEALWNQFDLQRPTALTCKVSSREIDVNSFITKIDKIIKDLESQEMLHFEAALLGRLIYRMKCKFRSDKGLKNMEKTNRALLNYLKLRLENDYKYLKECIEINKFANYVLLPTKQMVEYTLVKTQSFAKLMCRIENVSREAARFLQSRINIGQSWDVSLIALSVISRIWVLSRHLIKKSCDWYKLLHESSINFKTAGAEWLPKTYNLPFDLKCWLNLSWIDEVLPSISTHEEIKQNIFNLIKPTDDDSEQELNFEIEDIPETPKPSLSIKKSQIVEQASVSKEKEKKNAFSLGLTDIGKPISRDAFNSMVKKQSQNVKLEKNTPDQKSGKKIDNSIKKCEKIVDVKKKLKFETEEKSSKKNLTPDSLKTENDLILFLQPKSYPGMDKLEWKILKKNVRKFLVEMNNSSESVSKKKKLKMVIKKIKEWTS